MSVQLGVGPVCFGNDEPARRLFLERDLTKWWTVKMPEASARSWSQALKRIGLQAVVRSGELYYSGPDVAAEQS
jgi:hypothetical protein